MNADCTTEKQYAVHINMMSEVELQQKGMPTIMVFLGSLLRQTLSYKCVWYTSMYWRDALYLALVAIGWSVYLSFVTIANKETTFWPMLTAIGSLCVSTFIIHKILDLKKMYNVTIDSAFNEVAVLVEALGRCYSAAAALQGFAPANVGKILGNNEEGQAMFISNMRLYGKIVLRRYTCIFRLFIANILVFVLVSAAFVWCFVDLVKTPSAAREFTAFIRLAVLAVAQIIILYMGTSIKEELTSLASRIKAFGAP